MAEPGLVELKGIYKSFGEVIALNGVDLSLARREIHGLLGGNGAGKTTLMNILYGLYRPDAGEAWLRGALTEIRSPSDAIAHGVGMVHQHFLQIGEFTVTQNIVLGTSARELPILRLDQASRRIGELSQRFGLDVEPSARVQDLPMGVRQRVEILKALYRGVDLLILDEPTTHLTPQEVDHLFESLRTMVDEGMSVVFITHKLREVMNVCDRVSVLRNGRRVLTAPMAEADEQSLVNGMVGEQVDVKQSLLFSGAVLEPSTGSDGPPRLELRQLSVAGEGDRLAVQQANLAILPGEIFGVAGVAGNGQREIVEAVLNIRAKAAGEVLLNGKDISAHPTAEILRRGVAYVPEDRVSDGYLPTVSVAHNLILGSHRSPPYARRGLLDRKRILAGAQNLIEAYNIQTRGPNDLAARLSGGNIQRLMIARVFSRPIKLLLAHNLTSGLDIPSVEFVYAELLNRIRDGASAVLLSDDLDELLLLCDRIGVLYRGRIVGVLPRAQYDRYEIGRLMSGASVIG
jgi:general nucleoside transport system ATP-binding protein